MPELLLPLFSFCNSLWKAQIMVTFENKRFIGFGKAYYGQCGLYKFEPPSFEQYENSQKQNYQASVDFPIHNEDWTFWNNIFLVYQAKDKLSYGMYKVIRQYYHANASSKLCIFEFDFDVSLASFRAFISCSRASSSFFKVSFLSCADLILVSKFSFSRSDNCFLMRGFVLKS